MSLDLIEMLMHVEDHFETTIHDAEAERLQTVGQLHDLVLRKVEAWEPEPAWRSIRFLVSDKLGVPREQVTREARLLDFCADE